MYCNNLYTELYEFVRTGVELVFEKLGCHSHCLHASLVCERQLKNFQIYISIQQDFAKQVNSKTCMIVFFRMFLLQITVKTKVCLYVYRCLCQERDWRILCHFTWSSVRSYKTHTMEDVSESPRNREYE